MRPQLANRGYQHQPYRKGQREPGAVLDNMLAGKPTFMRNPAQLKQEQMRRLALIVRQMSRG